MSINIIYHKHKCKKGITQLALTSQRRADRCDLEFLKYYIWSGCYILLLKSTFFFRGRGMGRGGELQHGSVLLSKTVWFSEGCVLQWQEFECGLNLFRISKYTVWILKQQQLAPGTEITIDYSVDTQVVPFIWMNHWRQIPPKGHYDNSN